MNERLRQAMRPTQYYEPVIADPHEPEEGVDAGAVDVPRTAGGKDAVKPLGGSLDTSPLHYRRARPDKNEVDLDDSEYEEETE